MNNLMIPKILVEHNVPWATEEKLSITRSLVPAWAASMCPAGMRVLVRTLTAPAPYTGR